MYAMIATLRRSLEPGIFEIDNQPRSRSNRSVDLLASSTPRAANGQQDSVHLGPLFDAPPSKNAEGRRDAASDQKGVTALNEQPTIPDDRMSKTQEALEASPRIVGIAPDAPDLPLDRDLVVVGKTDPALDRLILSVASGPAAEHFSRVLWDNERVERVMASVAETRSLAQLRRVIPAMVEIQTQVSGTERVVLKGVVEAMDRIADYPTKHERLDHRAQMEYSEAVARTLGNIAANAQRYVGPVSPARRDFYLDIAAYFDVFWKEVFLGVHRATEAKDVPAVESGSAVDR